MKCLNLILAILGSFLFYYAHSRAEKPKSSTATFYVATNGTDEGDDKYPLPVMITLHTNDIIRGGIIYESLNANLINGHGYFVIVFAETITGGCYGPISNREIDHAVKHNPNKYFFYGVTRNGLLCSLNPYMAKPLEVGVEVRGDELHITIIKGDKSLEGINFIAPNWYLGMKLKKLQKPTP